MVQDAEPLIGMSKRYRVVAPRSRAGSGARNGGAVLGIWVSRRAIELAEELAAPSGDLCLIAGGAPASSTDTAMWVRRSQAVNLTDPQAGPAEGLDLDPAVTKLLDFLLQSMVITASTG